MDMYKEKKSLEYFSYYPVIGLMYHPSKNGNLHKEVMGLYNNKNELRTLLLKVHEHSKLHPLLRFLYEIFNIDNYGYNLCLVHLYASWVMSSEYTSDRGVSMNNPLITTLLDNKISAFTMIFVSASVAYILNKEPKGLDWPDDIDYIEELDTPNEDNVSIWSLFNWATKSNKEEKTLLIEPQTMLDNEIEVPVTGSMQQYIKILSKNYTKDTICIKIVDSLYRREALNTHPDKNDPNSNHRFLILKDAKAQLTELIEESNNYKSSQKLIKDYQSIEEEKEKKATMARRKKRSDEYKIRSKEYEIRRMEYEIRDKEYEIRSKEYEIRDKEFWAKDQAWKNSKAPLTIKANIRHIDERNKIQNKIKAGEISKADGEKLISDINIQFEEELAQIEEQFKQGNPAPKI